MIYNATRGTDSTGAAAVKKAWNRKEKQDEWEYALAKELGHPYNLFEIKRAGDFDWSDIGSGNNKCLLGHNRSATEGSVTRRNAHPFVFTNIVGMHNGTLKFGYKNKLPEAAKFGTDSECILWNIDKSGIEETIKHMEGAWALVWFDFSLGTINLLRNKERSLYYVFSEDEQTLFWSSEWEHLASACNYTKTGKIKLLPENQHHSWEVPTNNSKFEEASVVSRKGLEPEPVKQYLGYQGSSPKKEGDYGMYAPFWDVSSGCWKRWDQERKKHLYSIYKFGEFVDTPEEAMSHTYTPGGERIDNDKSTDKVVSFSEQANKNKKLDQARGRVGDRRLSPLIYSDSNMKVHWSMMDKMYNVLSWDGKKNEWELNKYKLAPAFIPFTKMDINARHEFHHTGKKEKKRIYYKGYNGKLLDESSFNVLMNRGCLQCDRQPIWGNRVLFLNDTDFLCEHCERDSDSVKIWKEANSVQQSSGNA